MLFQISPAPFRAEADTAQATYATQMTEQRAVVTQAERRAKLTDLAYRAGQTSRLELLDAQPAICAALIVRRDQLSAAALYRAIGGHTEAQGTPR